MLTITSQQMAFTRIGVITTALIGILFLEPCILPRCEAQDKKDRRDIVIEYQKQLLDKQMEAIELLLLQLKKAQLLASASKKTVERLSAEIDFLNNVIKERESSILELETTAKKFRIAALNAEMAAQLARIRNENLADEVRELTAQLARGKGKPAVPNPPKVRVNGKVQIVSGGDLIQIDLGTDHGVAKGETLDVYRLTPQPQYVGMVQIVDANTSAAVCRLIKGADGKKTAFQVGDRVTSHFGLIQDDPVAALNPPMKRVDGQIEKIDAKDAHLVQINVGKDHGLAKDHTLDVYRLLPDAKYLGVIRIVEVTATSAVGRFVQPKGKSGEPMFKIGDRVTSTLTSGAK